MKWCRRHEIYYETEEHYACLAEANSKTPEIGGDKQLIEHTNNAPSPAQENE